MAWLRYQPSLHTQRLRLRPLVADDAETLCELGGERAVADTAIALPHPYSLGAARAFIAGMPHYFRTGRAVHFAISLQSAGQLIGSVALDGIDEQHAQGELSFWLGRRWWGFGYATEAAWQVMRFGFGELSLNRICAQQLARDPSAGKVLAKLGMKEEGLLRQRVRKLDLFEDVRLYATLRQDALLS